MSDVTGSILDLHRDDTIREVHGYKKQGAAYGYSGVKGRERAAGRPVVADMCPGDRGLAGGATTLPSSP